MRTQLINFTIPEELLRQVDKIAKKESRSRAEFLREAARRLIREEKERQRDFTKISQAAKRVNLPENEAIALVDTLRAKLLINK